MSTHKHFDKICCVVLAFTLLLTVLFVNGEKLGIQKASTVSEYEKTIFDKSRVHTIDIVMDDWGEFIANCKSEEYYTCSVVIDGEAFKNVAIRGKGNTSLSSVNNDRYSYKIEFDHYDNTNTYYGLDKLCLNNIIQDNTYMKDYLTYTMMYDMGVAAPLCSYAYITVNGEDWGLYLAVEGVEESFLQRNYGKDYGELYKPDSMSMGGGRGNGDKFDMDEFMENSAIADKKDNTTELVTQEKTTDNLSAPEKENTTNKEQVTEKSTSPENGKNPFGDEIPEGMTPPENGGNPFGGEMPEGMTPPENGESPFGGEMTEGMTPPENGGSPFGRQMSEGSAPSISGMSNAASDNTQDNSSQGGMFGSMTPPDFGDSEMPDMNGMPSMDFKLDEEAVREAFEKLGIDDSLLEGIDFDNITMSDIQDVMSEIDEDMLSALMEELGDEFSFGGGMPDMSGGFGGMGSSDVKLQYIDDDADSYSNIFENAKTDITDADKTRLIEALERLSNEEDLADTVDIEAVIRYFVVHNFVVNGDSYTGSMIHNYYLYEKDGQLQMIPWDYNLAFGSFQSMGGSTNSVNDPIDTPLSVDGSGDRPMADWIFSNDEYTELYHEYFNEFIEKYFDNSYFEEMIDNVSSMISPYVEKDPTKFCTYEEFEKGITTLKEFCLLRAESVRGQLDGTIGSTSETQTEEMLIDASHINISDMGSMGMGGGKGGFGGNMQKPQNSSDDSGGNDSFAGKRPGEADTTESNDSSNSRPQMPEGFGNGKRPEMSNAESGDIQDGSKAQLQRPDGGFTDKGQSPTQSQDTNFPSSLVLIGISVLILCIGIVFAMKFKRRK